MASYRAGLLLAVTCLAATAALAQPRRNELNSTGVPPGDYGKTLRSAEDMALPNNYERDETWLKFPKGRVPGATSALDIDRDGKSVWLVERCAGGGGGWGRVFHAGLEPGADVALDGGGGRGGGGQEEERGRARHRALRWAHWRAPGRVSAK